MKFRRFNPPFYKKFSRQKSLAYLVFLIVSAILLFFEFINEPEFKDEHRPIDESVFLEKDTYCRIGMSYKPKDRLIYWMNKYQNREQHTVIECDIIGIYESKKEAQKTETREIKVQSCDGHPGGGGPERAKWFVYKLTIFRGQLNDDKKFCDIKKIIEEHL